MQEISFIICLIFLVEIMIRLFLYKFRYFLHIGFSLDLVLVLGYLIYQIFIWTIVNEEVLIIYILYIILIIITTKLTIIIFHY